MKTKNLLIATTLAALGLTAACKPKVTDSGIRYVAVKDGLNMREEPSPTGKKMLTIPYRQEVLKLEEKPESFTIDKTEGKWTKVSWKGKTGWVFGGFLLSKTSGDLVANSDSHGETDSLTDGALEEMRSSQSFFYAVDFYMYVNVACAVSASCATEERMPREGEYSAPGGDYWCIDPGSGSQEKCSFGKPKILNETIDGKETLVIEADGRHCSMTWLEFAKEWRNREKDVALHIRMNCRRK